MGRSSNSIDIRLISKVSSLYYHQELNQQEIANRLQISRPKVSRLLKQAKEHGIVKITVASPNSDYIELESLLEKKYRLKEVLVVETDADGGNQSKAILKKRLGFAAANYLTRTLKEDDVIGVTWGTTLQALIDTLQPQLAKNVHVIQTLGGVGPPEAKAHATDISRRLSQLLECRLTLLPAPGIVDSIEAKNVLLADRRVKNALQLFPKINIAYVGIGSLKTNPVLKKESPDVPSKLQQEILRSDAVGDIGLNFFDLDGNEIETQFKDLFIGMTLNDFKKIDTVVGIAGGNEKFQAITGALNGKMIDVLITDQTTAKKLADEMTKPNNR